MKSSKKLKRNLDFSLWNKLVVWALCLLIPFATMANPVPNGSFTVIEERSLIEEIGLKGSPIWCYDNQANATLITAPAREKARCELKTKYEIQKLNQKHMFEVDRLKLRLETLTAQHSEINSIKDQEIENLTRAALKRPNDNSIYWALGGVVVGVVSTILVGWAVTSNN
jgi:hypothetical protein